jgi:hypothetical protein
MNRKLLYKILLIANITITILLCAFVIIFKPSGRSLFLILLMVFCGSLGALAMYFEIRKMKKSGT